MVQISAFPSYYNVQFSRTIKEVEQGTIKQVMIIPMVGRIYKPDRDKQGHFIDTVGVRDNRIMVMGQFDFIKKIMDEFYWVAKNKDELNEVLNEVPIVVEESQ